MGLDVLITNITSWPLSGTVVFTRDLALELKRQGHRPTVFSSRIGPVVEALETAGIPVVESLRRVRHAPDVIHGHHARPTMAAVRRWPAVPAIFICHNHEGPADRAPRHRNVLRYFGVSRLCVERLRRDGVGADDVGLLLNFVDMERFPARDPIRPAPRRALVFSNYAAAGTQLPAVTEACRRAGIALDVIGVAAGTATEGTGELLGRYDIVFAKAKAALEAMSVGAAVVLCDFGGVGPMVTLQNFDVLRPMNFGFEALGDPLDPAILEREMRRYDEGEVRRVRDRVRRVGRLDVATQALVGIYRDVIAEIGATLGEDGASRTAPSEGGRDAAVLRLAWGWERIPRRWRAALQSIPGIRRWRRPIAEWLRAGG